MSPQDEARFHRIKRGGWSEKGSSWGQRQDTWAGTFANPFDITHPQKEVDTRNPWASK